MSARSITLILGVTLTLGSACDSNRAIQPVPPQPDPSVLTTLEALPSNLTLERGSTVELKIVARDQRGVPMTEAGIVTFSSSDSAARVNRSGFVTGVAVGTAEISVTKTVAGVTRSATMTAAIVEPSASPVSDLEITADLALGWQPSVGHLNAGGTVRWLTVGPRSWQGVEHRMLYLFDKLDTVVDSLDLRTGSARLKLMTAGEYHYCSAGCWDPPDYGIIYVH